MFRVMKTSLRRNIFTFIKIAILLLVIVVAFEFRLLDYILSGVSKGMDIKLNGLEIFDGIDVLESIEVNKLHKNKMDYQNEERKTNKADLLCPDYPPNLKEKVLFRDTISSLPSFESIVKENSNIINGGQFTPNNCIPRHKVAIIIPFRNREHHLRVFLAHMHPIWQRQQIGYKVFVITQAGNEFFNRAKLMNIGVVEAEKDGKFDCYVFQDVDLLLEDDRCLYWCHEDNPRHLSMYVDKFAYKRRKYSLRCPPLSMPVHEKIPVMGGATMLSRKQYQTVNGFSNLYWGWGGEDDDLYLRVKNRGYDVVNPYGKHCSFRMIKHVHSSGSPNNNASLPLLFHAMTRMDIDGYKNIRYRRLVVDSNSLYTNVTVDLGQPSAKMKDFMSQSMGLSWNIGCWKKMPWDT